MHVRFIWFCMPTFLCSFDWCFGDCILSFFEIDQYLLFRRYSDFMRMTHRMDQKWNLIRNLLTHLFSFADFVDNSYILIIYWDFASSFWEKIHLLSYRIMMLALSFEVCWECLWELEKKRKKKEKNIFILGIILFLCTFIFSLLY